MKDQTATVPSNGLPRLVGLVLAGGKSTRMGRDKGMIDWHGKAQRYYLADQLADYCDEVVVSCRADQCGSITDAGYKPLSDNSEATGQYGAILTALNAYPDSALLVVACDLPLINSQALAKLVHSRNSHKLATAYRDTTSELAEPLAAIWEPSAQKMLLRVFSEGITCPRKALILNKSEVKLIDPPTPETIMNVNTPEAAQSAREILKSNDYAN